jgi:riboflavin synthase alpha subunit
MEERMSEVELEIGDVIEIGGVSLTVVEIDQGEVTFRIHDSNDDSDCLESLAEIAVPR